MFVIFKFAHFLTFPQSYLPIFFIFFVFLLMSSYVQYNNVWTPISLISVRIYTAQTPNQPKSEATTEQHRLEVDPRVESH